MPSPERVAVTDCCAPGAHPPRQELHYFDEVCDASPPCDPALERHYIRDMMRLPEVARKNFSVAAFDATPMYSRMVFGNVSFGGSAAASWGPQ